MVFQLFKKHSAGIILTSLFGAAIALAISFTLTPLYQSTVRILVLQKNDRGIDAYTLSRASERIGNNLATILQTSAFLDRVIATGLVSSSDFSKNESTRRKEWESFIHADLVPETSILAITATHAQRDKAEKIVIATESVLLSQSAHFLSVHNDEISLQVVDAPLTSLTPVSPNIPAHVAAGFAMGLLLSLCFALVRELIHANRELLRTTDDHISAPSVASHDEFTASHYKDESSLASQIPAVIRDQDTTDSPHTAFYASIAPADTISSPGPILPHRTSGEKIRTMHDDVQAPFGNQYYFENRVIQLDPSV